MKARGGGCDMSPTYGTMLALAATLSAVGSLYFAGRFGIDRRKSALCFLLIGAAIVVGARALHLMTHGASESLEILSLRPVGFDLFGGLVAGAAVGALVAKFARCNAWKLADAAIVPLLIGIVLVRVGCYYEGCCFGVTTDLPWGMIPSPESQAGLSLVITNPVNLVEPVRIHPTQLYEMAGAAFAAGMAAVILWRKSPAGMASLVGCLTLTASRLLILPLRDLGPASQRYVAIHATLYLLLLSGAAIILWWRRFEQLRCENSRAG
jgi:phosphatidylglycerol---prolipoprotein diacylglyceryl transferase